MITEGGMGRRESKEGDLAEKKSTTKPDLKKGKWRSCHVYDRILVPKLN
jgi:hypothetical protein